jgi:hypothetical protein
LQCRGWAFNLGVLRVEGFPRSPDAAQVGAWQPGFSLVCVPPGGGESLSRCFLSQSSRKSRGASYDGAPGCELMQSAVNLLGCHRVTVPEAEGGLDVPDVGNPSSTSPSTSPDKLVMPATRSRERLVCAVANRCDSATSQFCRRGTPLVLPVPVARSRDERPALPRCVPALELRQPTSRALPFPQRKFVAALEPRGRSFLRDVPFFSIEGAPPR